VFSFPFGGWPCVFTWLSIIKEFSKQLDGKCCFKCQGYGHFQADCPKRRALTLKIIQEIDQLTLKSTEETEEKEEELKTVLTLDVGELLVLLRRLNAKESSRE